MSRRIPLAVCITAAVIACASNNPDPNTEPEVVNARVLGIEAPIKRGDCAEAARRAAANPELEVERVPAPVTMKPLPVDAAKMPKGVADKNGFYELTFKVLVDTLGKPDMKTFTVVSASNAWLAGSARSAVAKWTFTPAEVAGCKVPRTYSLGVRPAKKKPAATKKPPGDDRHPAPPSIH
jgi:hypothetical protein